MYELDIKDGMEKMKNKKGKSQLKCIHLEFLNFLPID